MVELLRHAGMFRVDAIGIQISCNSYTNTVWSSSTKINYSVHAETISICDQGWVPSSVCWELGSDLQW